MSHLFRSEAMQRVRLTITHDACVDTMRELGQLGNIHLIDLNHEALNHSENYLYYKKRVLDCLQWERHLARVEDEMEAHGVELPEHDLPIVDYLGGDVLSALESYLEPLERELNRNIEYKNAETKQMNELSERIIVLRVIRDHLFFMRQEQEEEEARAVPEDFRSGGARASSSDLEMHLLRRSEADEMSRPFLQDYEAQQPMIRPEAPRFEPGQPRFHNYITGIVPTAQQGLFGRMVFRVSRGNAFLRFFPVDDPVADPETGEAMEKTVFYAAFVGEQMHIRISKICDYFRAAVYEVPETPEHFQNEMLRLEAQVREKKQVLDITTQGIVETLEQVARDSLGGSSPLRNWQEAIRREILVCDALKKCQLPDGSNMILAEGWVPSDELDSIKLAVRQAVRHSGAQPAWVQEVRSKEAPPTYFRVDDMTSSFQGIVNTYGIPRYQEVNPGLFTIVTFPFLFGIMYGDIGHGTCLFLAALYLVLNENKLGKLARARKLGELPTMAYHGRYLLLGMGMCAMYAGLVYNDCFSIPIDAFGTQFYFPTKTYENATWRGDVYPFGVDPGWYHTRNELTFFNSLKMKISVTFGVMQMTFGIVLGLFNHLYFKDTVSIVFEFIPQLLFMLSTFGYMIFLIIFKFTIDWSDPANGNPPNLIQTMIKQFLSPGSVEDAMYSGQAGVQAVLVLIAFISVPWMLFPKPLWHRYQHNKRMRGAGKGVVVRPHPGPQSVELDDDFKEDDDDVDDMSREDEARALVSAKAGASHAEDDDDEEPFEFSEHFIHQSIHTIEFVLGCVSNTASYLRLWALSLAHAELSNVFWEKLIMQYGVKTGSPIMIFVTFGAWAGATFAVLLCMDVLECFLHALRLHWVEFQNKFFHADGYLFEPFTFAEVIEE